MTIRKLLSYSLVLSIACAAAAPHCAFSIGAKKNADAQQENMEIRDKWALLIGVNRFSDKSIPALKYAQKSSGDMARALKDPDTAHFALDHVLVVNGPDANKAYIEQAFNEWLYKKALPNDLVVIYFNSRLAQDPNGEMVVCANDTRLADPAKSGMKIADLLKEARQRIGSPHIICMLDTSPVGNSLDKPAHDTKWLAANSGVTVFSAAELMKPSLDDTAGMQSLFVHCFLDAVKTGGGNYPLAMVAEYVWQKVQELSKQIEPAGQVPVLVQSNEQSQTLSIPLGIMVKSSLPPKTVAIGHPVDNLGMDHPNIVAPTSAINKPGIVIQSRNQTTGAGKLQAGKQTANSRPHAGPVAAAVSGPNKKPVQQQLQQAAKNNGVLASTDDSDEDDFDSSLDLRPYITKIKQDIQKKWQAPKGFESRHVTTMFSINRDGSITNASVVEGSGNEDMDKSALAALQAASPLDPLPKGAPKSVDIKYVFDWKTRLGSQ